MDKISAIVLSVIFIFGIIVCAACSKATLAEKATTVEVVETTEVIEVETSEGETFEEETILEETSVDTIPETSFEDIAEAIG